jgi:hypothetical protein
MNKPAACLAAFCLSIQPAIAQVPVLVTPGQANMSRALGSLGELAGAIGELATQNLQIEDELVAARVAYFNSPAGAPRLEAARRFDEALMRRDMHYVSTSLLNMTGHSAPGLREVVDFAGSNSVDGGLSPYCSDSFTKWANEYINMLEQTKSPAQALKITMPLYERYRLERDIAEILFHNPHGPLRAENPKPDEYLAAWILGSGYERTQAAANATAARMVATAGPERIAQIVKLLRSWSKVDSSLSGPWSYVPKGFLDSLVAGKQLAQDPLPAGPGRIQLMELRDRFIAAKAQELLPQLDEILQIFNTGRANADPVALKPAIAKREQLQKDAWAIVNRDPWNRSAVGDGLMLDLKSKLKFIDSTLGTIAFNQMAAGQMNPEEAEIARERREYLATSSKLQSRVITNRERQAAERSRQLQEDTLPRSQGARRRRDAGCEPDHLCIRGEQRSRG